MRTVMMLSQSGATRK